MGKTVEKRCKEADSWIKVGEPFMSNYRLGACKCLYAVLALPFAWRELTALAWKVLAVSRSLPAAEQAYDRASVPDIDGVRADGYAAVAMVAVYALPRGVDGGCDPAWVPVRIWAGGVFGEPDHADRLPGAYTLDKALEDALWSRYADDIRDHDPEASALAPTGVDPATQPDFGTALDEAAPSPQRRAETEAGWTPGVNPPANLTVNNIDNTEGK